MRMNRSSVDVVWDPQTQISSLDYWDYSVELACLQGPEGRQIFSSHFFNAIFMI